MIQWGITFLTLVLACNSQAWARDGVDSSGGGDHVQNPFDDFAWFYGKGRTIRTCFEVTPDFGATESALKESISQAFSTWKSYIDAKKADDQMFDGKFSFATNIVHLARCDGSEDLKFYFGIHNAEIEKAKKKYKEPVAIAALTEFDSVAHWGKGFVWVASHKSLFDGTYPDWTDRYNLSAILLHEIGHIYGNSHVPGTIMTARIMDLLNERISSTRKTSIDIHRELYECTSCSLKREGYAVLYADGKPTPTYQLIKKILGREISSLNRIIISRQGGKKDYQLEIIDETRGTRDQFDIRIVGLRTVGGPYVFSKKWMGWSRSNGYIEYGVLKTRSGELVNLFLESNLVDYEQSSPEYSTLMTIRGFIEEEIAELVDYKIEHKLLP